MQPESNVVAVIVNYNTGNMLREAIDSLLAGSVKPAIEIVDNASTDGSVEVVKNDPKYDESVSITINEENLGFSRAVNRVLKIRAAKYFLLVNPDCVVDQNAVLELVSYMDRNPDVGMAGGKLKNPDGSIQKTSKRRIPTPWSALARSVGVHRINVLKNEVVSDFDLARETREEQDPEEVEAISGAMMFVRSSTLPEVGLLDEGYFLHCEDLDWCKRFRDAGLKVAYVPSAAAVHKKGGSGRGPKVVWHLHRGMSRFYRKHYRSRYPAILFVAVQAAIYLRCGVLVLASLIKFGR